MTFACLFQVLSTSVANALAYEKKPHLKETERFVRVFDMFFDLMNTRCITEAIKKRKPNFAPYTNDPESERRLQVLWKCTYMRENYLY